MFAVQLLCVCGHHVLVFIRSRSCNEMKEEIHRVINLFAVQLFVIL